MSQKALSPAQRQFLTRVLGNYQKFAAEPGEDREGRERLAAASGRLGVIYYRLGQPQEADGALQKAVELYTGLAADYPNRFDYRLELAANHANRGNVLSELVELEAAKREYQSALKLKEQLLAEKPDDPDYRSQLAEAHRTLGLINRQQGHRADAARSFRSAFDLLEKLAADFPSVADNRAAAVYHWELTRSRSDIGNLYFEMAETEKAEAALGAAVARFEELATYFRDSPDHRDEVAIAYLNWGRALYFVGETEKAESAYQAALTREERLVADYPGVPDYRRTLGQIRVNLAVTKTTLAKKKLAASLSPSKRAPDIGEAEKLAESKDTSAARLYDAARAFALAARSDPATAERHAARAVAVLRQAFARGFGDIPRMARDSDLDSLRQRPDYIELLWDVADGR